ncbi:reverse transcriptase domain-containing protein [Tanacetum coccineum]
MLQSRGLTSEVSQEKDGGLAGLPPLQEHPKKSLRLKQEGSSNRRDVIRERTDGTMLTPEKKLRYICMAAVRHDRSTAINSGTLTQSGKDIHPFDRRKWARPWSVQKPSKRRFHGLKQACPQDCYPLPEIDWKVESLCGYPFKCFLDAYKGYHQIQMTESDEEKTAFHTSQWVYCYTKMPFGLKNVGATYHRLVDKAFDSQVGRNMEVYVDDLVLRVTQKQKC